MQAYLGADNKMQAYVGKKVFPKYWLSIIFLFVGKGTGHTIPFGKFLEQLLVAVLVALGNPDLC